MFVIISLLLTGCSSGKEQNIDNPCEIAKGSSILSYYDSTDKISKDDFDILDLEPENVIGIANRNKNCVIIKDNVIRCFYIVDDNIVTYKQISVGDSVDKVKDTFEHEGEMPDHKTYSVIFNGTMEEDPANQNKQDNWVWINYITDGSQITQILIYDVKYGRELK